MQTQQGEMLHTRNENNDVINLFAFINKLKEWEVRVYLPDLIVNRDRN